MRQSPGFEAEGRTLVLVHQVHPAPVAVDELEGGDVVVHVVGHRPCFRDADVRGDDRPAEAPRNEVPVVHAGAAHPPRAAVRALALHHQGVPGGRALQAGVEVAELDAGAVGGGELPHAVPEYPRILAVEPDQAGSVGAAAVEADPHAVAREHRLRRVVGGKDGIEPEAELFAEEGEVRGQVAARQEQLGLRCAAGRGTWKRLAGRSGIRARVRARLIVQRNPLSQCVVRTLPDYCSRKGVRGSGHLRHSFSVRPQRQAGYHWPRHERRPAAAARPAA